MSIVVVGTVAFDAIETPFGAVDRILGGSATYIGMAGRYFCPDIGLVAVVGGDFSEADLSRLREQGLNLEGVQIDREGKTFFWAGRYHYDLNERETLTTDLNVLASFKPVVPDAYRKARIVCLGNLDPTVQLSVLDQVENPEMVICDTMNYWIEQTPGPLADILRRVDCLIVNDSEARELTGEPNLIKAARAIMEMGPRVLVIKKGEHGALLFTEEVVFSAPAFPLEDIEDPTGAGDSFMGGFAGYLARTEKIDLEALKCAVVFGSAMASFTVEAFGPERLFGLSDADIQRRVTAFRTLSHVPIPIQEIARIA